MVYIDIVSEEKKRKKLNIDFLLNTPPQRIPRSNSGSGSNGGRGSSPGLGLLRLNDSGTTPGGSSSGAFSRPFMCKQSGKDLRIMAKMQ